MRGWAMCRGDEAVLEYGDVPTDSGGVEGRVVGEQRLLAVLGDRSGCQNALIGRLGSVAASTEAGAVALFGYELLDGLEEVRVEPE